VSSKACVPFHEHAVLEDWCLDATRFRAGREIGNVPDGKDGDETEELCCSGEGLHDSCAAEAVEYYGMC